MSTLNIKNKAKINTDGVDEIIDNIVAIHEHEGVTPSPKSIDLSKQVLEKKISADAAVAKIIEQ